MPEVTNTDVSAFHSDMLRNPPSPLQAYKRSDKTYERKVASIYKRLDANASEMCELSDRGKCQFDVSYVPNDTFNAYASEGHKIAIHRGILRYLKSDDEMAAVIAHEMGHHLANHIEETKKNANTGAIVSGILSATLVAAASYNNPSYNTYYQQQQNQEFMQNMMGAGAKVGAISYSKEQEREADLLGAYLLARAGYDLDKAHNMLRILNGFRVASGVTKSRASLMDTHPAGPERVIAWGKIIDEINNNSSLLPYPKNAGFSTDAHK